MLLNCTEKIFCMENLGDYLIYKNDTCQIELQEWPLENYYNGKTKPTMLYLDQKRGLKDYSAYWEIRNDSLFLRKVLVWGHEVSISQLFKGNKNKYGVFANWYHGTLKINFGNPLIPYLVYESGKDFIFKSGIVSQSTDYHFTVTKRSEYSIYPKLLMQFIKDNLNYNIPEVNKDGMVIVSIQKVNDSGKIEKVKIMRPLDEIRNKEAVRVALSIPYWDVIYRNGKRYIIHDNIVIKFGQKK